MKEIFGVKQSTNIL